MGRTWGPGCWSRNCQKVTGSRGDRSRGRREPEEEGARPLGAGCQEEGGEGCTERNKMSGKRKEIRRYLVDAEEEDVGSEEGG